jgi:hypothetical protein
MGNPFGSLFLESFRMMVRLGLARSHVQPCPRKTLSIVIPARFGMTRSRVRRGYTGPVAQVARAHP